MATALLRALARVAWATIRSVPCMFDHHHWTIVLGPGNNFCTRCGTPRY